MSESRAALIARFHATLRARLRRVSEALDEALDARAAARAHPGSHAACGELHTLKGEARMLGLSELALLAHELESLLTERASPDECSRVLQAMRRALEEGSAPPEGVSNPEEQGGFEAMLSELADHAQALAGQLGKLVRVRVRAQGAHGELMSVEALSPVLLHLLQNAVDHGLELPEERGPKPRVGRLAVNLQVLATGVTLEVEDDGRGIDWELLRSALVARGLRSADEAASLDPQQLSELLFEPGLSTRNEVTPLSGRGMGLDVVRRQVRAWGGRISVESEPGKGTRFVISVPRP